MLRVLFLCFLLIQPQAFAALTATTVWEIRQNATAGNVNGCGFDGSVAVPGTDYSQQASPQFNNTDLTVDAVSNTKVASAAHNFVASDEGNYIHITAGLSWTPGWYLITDTGSNEAFLDRSPAAIGVGGGTWAEGGACSLGASGAGISDDALVENCIPGMVYYLAGTGVGTGSYAPTAVSIAAAGTAALACKFLGYGTNRNDNPTGATRPTLAMAASSWVFGAFWEQRYFIVTSTASTGYNTGSNSKALFVKSVNSSTNTARNAISVGAGTRLIASEAVSYRGNALAVANGGRLLVGNYLHDSSICMNISNTTIGETITFNKFEGCYTAAVRFTAAQTATTSFLYNLFYGAENKLGIGIDESVTGSTVIAGVGNIFYGLTTGLNSQDAAQTADLFDWNDFSNNTTNRTNFTAGANDFAANPGFQSVTQYTGATATTSGSVLTQAGAALPTLVAGTDYLYLVSGTGITVGVYGITANTATTITLDIAPGTNATADKVWQVTTGHLFTPKRFVKALGFPGAFPAGFDTGYLDVGPIQLKAPPSRHTGGGNTR